MAVYIHERPDWPRFRWRMEDLVAPLSKSNFMLGLVLGRMESLGFGARQKVNLDALVQEVRKSSEIEGEHLEEVQVRSSIGRRLGMDVAGLTEPDRNVEGVVEMVLDATQRYDQPLTEDRLFGWHSALFPSGRSGMQKIVVGAWRDDVSSSMQVVSGPIGGQRVHYEAPSADRLGDEMVRFLEWFGQPPGEPNLIFAALAHLWFVTIHPFDDGNGRIGRAVMDMALARSEARAWRCYSMSAQIQREKSVYYDLLERTQKGDLDVTSYLLWFIDCFGRALQVADDHLSKALLRGRFWQRYAEVSLNERQRKMLNLMLDDFRGKLTNEKWAKITKASHDTALRDLRDLVSKGILEQRGAGRGAGYVLTPFEEPQGSSSSSRRPEA